MPRENLMAYDESDPVEAAIYAEVAALINARQASGADKKSVLSALFAVVTMTGLDYGVMPADIAHAFQRTSEGFTADLTKIKPPEDPF